MTARAGPRRVRVAWVAAAALANARAFGGEDYVGFHTMMALSPSYAMSKVPARESHSGEVLRGVRRVSPADVREMWELRFAERKVLFAMRSSR